MKYRSIRTYQEEPAHSSKRYTPPVEVPVFSWARVSTGLDTPAWSPPYDIMITDINMAVTFSSEVVSGSTSIWILKINNLTVDEPVFITSISTSGYSFNNSKSLENSYTPEKIISPFDALFCTINSTSGVHSTASVNVYAERYRKL